MQKDHLRSKDPSQNKLQKIPIKVNQISLYFGNVQRVLFSFSKNNVNNKEYKYIGCNIRYKVCAGIKYISV